MGNLAGKLSALLLVTSSMLLASAQAATFSVSTVACGPQGNCDYGPFQSTAPGAPPANSAVAKSYVFVPPPGSGGGYSIGVNSSVALDAPDTWRVYAQAGGYINVQEPFALNAVSAYAGGGAGMLDTFTPQSTPTWNTTGFLRFSWLVEGSASVTYSAPGTPDQANAGVTLGFDCSYSSVAGAASSPCASPDFAPAPPGAYTLTGSRRFGSSQTFNEVLDFDVFVQADRPVTVSMGAGLSAGIGLLYGTPVGVLNGLAFGDFLNTGRLVAVTLFDSGGNAVLDAVLRSESGFDYLAVTAVPEPSAMLLLLAGLVAVAARQLFVGRAQMRFG